MRATARSLPDGGIRVWVPVIGPIALWMTHLVVEASLSRYTCNVHGDRWVQHVVTAALAAGVVGCIAVAARVTQRATDSEGSGTEAGRVRFIGLFAIGVGAINLALILLEGSYLVFIRPCV